MNIATLQSHIEQIQNWVIARRREFHQYPEAAWTEYYTSAKVAHYLEELGWKIEVGETIIKEKERWGVPSAAILEYHYQEVVERLKNNPYLEKMKNGLTGVVATLDTKRPGPTLTFRFDLDALPINESRDADHLPQQQKFVSIRGGLMHACGHDGHTAMGLGLAKLFASLNDQLSGKIKIIFQPAEEGLRGAYPMVKAGVVDDTDFFIATHLGLKAKKGELIVGATDFFASTKFKFIFNGKSAHAGIHPELGKNAMQAAATAVMGIYGISTHSEGKTRVNCGTLQSGTATNIIPDFAVLTAETRSDQTEVNEFLENRMIEICKGAANMYDVEVSWEIIGRGIACDSHSELAEELSIAALKTKRFSKIIKHAPFDASDDATYFMDAVIKRGGYATYIVLGTQLTAGHHQSNFDFDEEDVMNGIMLLAQIAIDKLTVIA